MSVICIFLAAKIEERKDIDLESFFKVHFKNDPDCLNLTVEHLKYLEIQLVKALEFQLFVHNP